MLFNNTYALPPEGVLTWSPFLLYPIGMPTLLSFGRSYLTAKPDVEAFLHHKPGVLNLPLGVRIGKLKLCLVILHLGRIPAGKLTSYSCSIVGTSLYTSRYEMFFPMHDR
jgi:hypothetical protein